MKVTSALLTTMSGKLGGAVASTARGGVQYFRKLVVPKNPQSYLQDVIRATLSSIAAAWKATLTDSQRAAWTALAKTGESGIDRYTAANTILMQGGSARQDTAPSTTDLAWLALPTPGIFLVNSALPGAVTATLNVAGNTLGADGEKISFYVQDRVQPTSRLADVGHPAYGGTFNISGTAHPTISISAFTHPLLSTTGASPVKVGVVKYKTNGQVSQRISALVTPG